MKGSDDQSRLLQQTINKTRHFTKAITI